MAAGDIEDLLLSEARQLVKSLDENRHQLVYLVSETVPSIDDLRIKVFKALVDFEEKRKDPNNYLAGVCCANISYIYGEVMEDYVQAKAFAEKAIKFAEADLAEVQSAAETASPEREDEYYRKDHSARGRLEKYAANLDTCIKNIAELEKLSRRKD